MFETTGTGESDDVSSGHVGVEARRYKELVSSGVKGYPITLS